MTTYGITAAIHRLICQRDPSDLIQDVRDGMLSVRLAARLLRCTTDEIQLAAWGKIGL